jgi:hypothetical protein
VRGRGHARSGGCPALGDPTGLDGHEGRIDRARTVHGFERGVDGRERQAAMEEENLDERPGPAGISEAPACPRPELLVGAREHTGLPRLVGRERTRHRSRLAGEDLEIVVEEERLRAADDAALVGGDHPSGVDELDRGAPDPRRQAAAGIAGRDRIEGLADADPGLGVDPDGHQPGGIEGLGGQRPEGRPVRLAHRADGGPAGPDVAGEVRPVGGLKAAVELGERADRGHGHEVASARAADLTLDAALLVGAALARDTEEGVEPVMRAQGDEPLRLLPVASPQDPGDQRLGIVVPDPGGNPAEPLEGDDVALEERLLALAAVRHVDRSTRMRQAQLEDRDPGLLEPDHYVGQPEVDLSLLARQVVGHDGDVVIDEIELAAGLADEPADGGLGEVRALLVDEALPDPACRVALLVMDHLVLGQPAPDGVRVRADRRQRSRGDPAHWRDRGGQRLADRPPVHAVAAREFADRQPFLPVIPADTLELLHPRHSFLRRS